MSNKTIKVRKKVDKDIDLRVAWLIVQDYVDSPLSMKEIAEKHKTPYKTVENTIAETYKRFQNIRETKALIATQKRPDVFLELKDQLDGTKINEEFIALLSEPDSLVLTDHEILYGEFYVDHGDEVVAIQDSGLDIRLNKRDMVSYRNACKMRSFYMRRKPNVAAYIKDIQGKKLEVMSAGKEHIQVELLSLLERLRNNQDPRAVQSILRAIELLGKTQGVFEDHTVIEHVGGDDALDQILKKARKVEENKKNPVAYVDGVEIYE